MTFFKADFNDKSKPVVRIPDDKLDLIAVIEEIWEMFQRGESLEKVKRALVDFNGEGER